MSELHFRINSKSMPNLKFIDYLEQGLDINLAIGIDFELILTVPTLNWFLSIISKTIELVSSNNKLSIFDLVNTTSPIYPPLS